MKQIKVTNILWDESEGKITKPEEMPQEIVLDYNEVACDYAVIHSIVDDAEIKVTKDMIDDAVYNETGWFMLNFNYEIIEL